jgi:hypothetical protein
MGAQQPGDATGVRVLDVVLIEPVQLLGVEAGGGLVDRIDIEHGTFTTEELNPTAGEIKEKVLEVAAN